MNNKGLSEVMVMMMLVMIGIMAGSMFYLHSQGSLDDIFKIFDNTRNKQINIEDALIYIENVTGNSIYVTNDGKVNLSSSSFAVFLNSSRINQDYLEIQSSSIDEIAPDQTAVLTVCHSSGLTSEDYFIEVNGPYKTFDEIRETITIPSC